MEAAITKQWVLIPAGLPLDSLSAPIRNLASSERPMSIKKSNSYPLIKVPSTIVLTLHFKIRKRLLYDELK
jgi:hypothetical protein